MHRVAEATIKDFVERVADRLTERLDEAKADVAHG
jgi:hypothetical protein